MEEQRKKLTPVQKRFVKEYVIDFNGTDAYIRASNTSNRKSASVQASKLLKMDKVKDAIDIYVKEQLGPLEKDLIGNVEFWISIRDDPNARTTDRLKASEQLAKYRSMFIEKKEVAVEGSIQIIDDIK